ncbi:MAG: PSD1 and planctomycete cytochrome C domain-containing protein [Planctomycetota bacterium]|nr:PSD1 and planctomycete cytochrome C domain-containing protein [Planctomycetota bacterium]
MRERRWVNGVAWGLLISLTGWFSDFASADEGIEFFERRIRPVLVKQCYQCHSAAAPKIQGGLRVDSRAAIRAGGETGPAVVPKSIAKSLIIEALRHESFKMPPKTQLPKNVIADFVTWIEMGAPDPRDHPPNAQQASDQAWDIVLRERSKWWSLQPVADVSPPELNGNDWSKHPIDRFILAELRERRLSPAAEADALTLLRRLSFVITGLPPSTEDVQTFPEHFAKSPEPAFAALVDKLLDSPHFGERISRHWMDVVRYTDTYGYEWDNAAKGSWEYRDYLIRAFNADIGFDHLIREHVAGDLLAKPRIGAESGLVESLIGPMFFHMGEHRHGDNVRINGVREEMIDNKIDAFSKAFLAMTVACARCHDHKLDAVSQRDYYALAGVFMTPRWTSRAIEAPSKHKSIIDELKQLRSSIGEELRPIWKQQAASFSREVVSAMLGDANDARSVQWRKALAVRQPETNPKTAKPNTATPTKLGEVRHVAARLASAKTDADVRKTWGQLAEEWRSEHRRRRESNQRQFQVLAAFERSNLPSGWITDGDGMRYGYVSDGEPLIALDGDRVVQSLLPRGYHTQALSSKLSGALRMPPQQHVPGKFVSLKLAGRQWSGSILMADNAFQTETVKFLDRSQTAWESFADLTLTNGIQRVANDIVTSDLNPNFPPRTGVARAGSKKLPNNDTGFDKRSWFSVTGIVTHDAAGQPTDDLARFTNLFAAPTPATAREAAQRLARWLASSVNDWADARADHDDVELLNWLLSQGLLTNVAAAESGLAKLINQYRTTEASLPFPRSVNSMDEREVAPIDYPLNIRGSIHERGLPVQHDFLQVFSDQHSVGRAKNSGRLELAEFLVDPQQALTARVYVNRVWQWVFGSGLVRTPNDFGRLGDRPSHPELLDHLAREFVTHGWSTKWLIRHLVQSRTFRQSGSVSERAKSIDPGNRLRHHFGTRRLEAESIRDSLLAVSGRIDRQLHGRPINPWRHSEDSAKRLFSGPIDGNGRRSIYLQVSIMDPSRFLLSFNFPDPKLPTGRRDVTNVPAQALVLLNDPFVLAMADHWAEQLIKDGHTKPAARIRAMFMKSFGRETRIDETIRWTAFAKSLLDPSSDKVMTDRSVWKQIAHTLFNAKEFTHYK